MSIKAIETSYKGCRFRSRLEARWAVFFEALGLRWEYEPQGFVIPHPHEEKEWTYLPDFLLPDFGTWVEVKGSWADVTADYLEMLANAVDWGGHLPGVASSFGTSHGLLCLEGVPDPDRYPDFSPAHPILQHSKGGWLTSLFFTPAPRVSTESHFYFDSTGLREDDLRGAIMLYTDRDAPILGNVPLPNLARKAYAAARSARFEYGERPSV